MKLRDSISILIIITICTCNVEGVDLGTIIDVGKSFTEAPSTVPSRNPTSIPTSSPSTLPTMLPTEQPSLSPSAFPTSMPSRTPTTRPSSSPSALPSLDPSGAPSMLPSAHPSESPTISPSLSLSPTARPSRDPSANPSGHPSFSPTQMPTSLPSIIPTENPSKLPSFLPTNSPSVVPTERLSTTPSLGPSSSPSLHPTKNPTTTPSISPSLIPTITPTLSTMPSSRPSYFPTITPIPFNFESVLLSDSHELLNTYDVILFENSILSKARDSQCSGLKGARINSVEIISQGINVDGTHLVIRFVTRGFFTTISPTQTEHERKEEVASCLEASYSRLDIVEQNNDRSPEEIDMSSRSRILIIVLGAIAGSLVLAVFILSVVLLRRKAQTPVDDFSVGDIEGMMDRDKHIPIVLEDALKISHQDGGAPEKILPANYGGSEEDLLFDHHLVKDDTFVTPNDGAVFDRKASVSSIMNELETMLDPRLHTTDREFDFQAD